MSEHSLTHAAFSDGSLTPACSCGWYSPERSHAAFERHLRIAVRAVDSRSPDGGVADDGTTTDGGSQ